MICGPLTRGAAVISVIRKTFPPVIAVPLLDAAESCPDSVDGMLWVRPKMAELSGEHSRAACGIDDPAATCRAFAKIGNGANPLPIPVVQFEVCYLCRTP